MSQRPDAVLCYGWATPIAWITIFTCLVARIPLVFYGDSTWQHSARPWLRLTRSIILRLLFRFAAGALSTGTFNREFYISFGMPPRNVVSGIVPVDVAAFEAARLDDKATIQRTGVMIGFAGKLTPRKGVDELLRALAKLKEVPEWMAAIAGDGPDRASLEALASELGIKERVQFLGFQNTSRMPTWLASCDVVVVPSRWDFRVLVVPEAMAAGACVVVSSATAVWGPGDLVEQGRTGLVYESGDPNDLAGCLRSLIERPDLRGALQEDGARRADLQGPRSFVNGVEAAVSQLGHGRAAF